MEINIKDGFLHLKISFLNPSFSIEISKISEFIISIDTIILIEFKLENSIQYVNCEGISKNDFIEMTSFVEKNINIPWKIYCCEENITDKFDKIEDIYLLTKKEKPDYLISDRIFYITFALAVVGTLVKVQFDLLWLNFFLTIIYIVFFITFWVNWIENIVHLKNKWFDN